tara:strand:+ start:304 stop:753 length:450 start_codon:yes stop_codon:yes gene_type:complete
MKREWKHPFWETAAKDRITCRLNITHDDGSFTTAVSSVSKYDENGKITKDYQEVLDQNPIPEIDKFTEERLERHKQRREAEIKKNKERQEAKRLEDLFNYKLQTFEIPEIKNSEDRKLKAKIRKSRNVIELNMYATMLMMKELNESESN